MKKIALYISVLSFSVLPVSAMADTVTFTNNDRMSGQFVDVNSAEGLHFKTTYGQTLFVPWDDVASMTDASGKAIAKPSGSFGTPYATMPASIKPPALSSSAATQKIVLTPPKGVAPINNAVKTAAAPTQAAEEPDQLLFDAPEFLGAIWKGRINAGLGIQEGNSETESFNLDGKIGADWNDIHRATIKAELNKETDNNVDTEDNMSINGAYDYFFAKKWFINANGGLEKDKIANLDLRSDVGVALGFQPYKSDALNLAMTLGPSYLHEKFENGTTDESAAGRWTFDYDQRILEETFQLFHNHEILVPGEDTDAYVLESETGIRMPIRGGIVGTAQIDYDRDNEPSAGIEKEDTEYTLKLGYEW